MIDYKATGSLLVRRLRSGDSLYMALEVGSVALMQAVDPSTGEVAPDWSVGANQPVITPRVGTFKGAAVTLSYMKWYHVGVELVFNGAESGGWKTDSTGKFQMNTSTGALKVVNNLASATNIASDQLTFSCVATVNGVEYNMSKSIVVLIQPTGASSYLGAITATTVILDADTVSTVLSTSLMLSVSAVSDYYVKWYKGTTAWTEKNGNKSITVTRDDVDGTQLFIAEFYKSSTDANPVFRAGIRVIDSLDEILIVPYISSTNQEVTESAGVTVKARILNTKTGSAITPTSPVWAFEVYNPETWELIKSGTTDSIDVTTAETDADGTERDVMVMVGVEFN